MKNSKIELNLLLLSMLFILSCEYEPKEVYNRPVNRNTTAPQIQTIELNLDDDTIFLYDDKLINFKFESSNQKIKQISYSIDGVPKGYVNRDSGEFYINYQQFTDGIHSLLIEIYTGSGTGSIADHVGTEGYLFSKSWVIVVDLNRYQGNTFIYNGFQNIRWAKYRKSDLKEYIVYKSSGLPPEIEIIRVKIPEFIDSSYVGEKCKYIIKVHTNSGKILDWSSIDQQSDLPKMYFKATILNQYIISWERTRYYNAVGTFILSQSLFNSTNYKILKSTQDPNDTVYENIGAIFGNKTSSKLKLVPKKNNVLYTAQYYSCFESELISLNGYPFKTNDKYIKDIHQINATEFIYVLGEDSLIKYSVSKKKETERIGYKAVGYVGQDFNRLITSPSGKYITCYVGSNDDVLWANSSNLHYYSLKNLKYLSGHNVPGIIISDIGTTIVNSMGNGFYIYDLLKSNNLAHYNLRNPTGYKISSNGDYIFVLSDSFLLMNYENSQFHTIWKQFGYGTGKFYEFDGINPNLLVFWDGTTFSIKRCIDFSTTYEYSLTDELICNIDYYSQEILTYNNGHLYVRNYTDGTIKKDITINFDPTRSSETCYLINHDIVTMTGIIYFIN